MLTIDVNNYGTNYKLGLFKEKYVCDNSIYIGTIVIDCDDRDDIGEEYGDITVNTYASMENCVTLDNNNGPLSIEAFLKHKSWYEDLGKIDQGFCTYPFVKLTDEFLNNVDTYDTLVAKLEKQVNV